MKERTGIPLRRQELLYGFPLQVAVFNVTDKVTSLIGNNEAILVREKADSDGEPKQATKSNTNQESRPKRKKSPPKQSEKDQEGSVKTIFDLQSKDENKPIRKKQKKDNDIIVTSSSMSIVGFIREYVKDNIYLVETYGDPQDLVVLCPWGIGPSLNSFSPYRVTSFSNTLPLKYKGDMKKWYVELKPTYILDVSGKDLISDIIQKHHPTSGEIVGKAIVFFKKWTKKSEIANTPTLDLEEMSSLKPKKSRRWDDFSDMPVTLIRELLVCFKYDKSGDIQELRRKFVDMINKKKVVGTAPISKS